ncbi:metallopeptidase TldD-related protein [Nocardia sp. NPDC023852]|uniref:metallopeptidase TldD-related protein n=1 Tax=Nocardia sp. NPDC023852 TaxID=3154697 RepID=UPI00340F3ECF
MIPAGAVVERALGLSRADEAMVIVRDEHEASLRWAGNSMTTNGSSVARTWAMISVFREGPTHARVGMIGSSSVDPDDIEPVVRASEDAARTAEPARDAMPLLEPNAAPDDDWAAAPGSTGIEVFTDLAHDLATGFDGADRLYGFAHHQVHTTWLGTSTGIRRRFVQPTGSVEVNGKRGAGAELASGWVGVGTADFTDVDVSGLLAELSRRLDWAKRKVELPAGRYETLMPPSTVADLMIYMAWAMEGRGAHEGHTAFARAGGTRIGERLTDLPLTLYSDPYATGLEYCPFVVAPASSESMSVFDNGLPAERVDWLREGVIESLVYPRATAAEFGAPTTVPGENLLLTGGADVTLDDMISRTERGLLLTTLWYIREVDPATLLLTGLTRDGVYLVENGEVTAAVNNFRFNESPLDVLRRATEAGATEITLPREWKDWFTRTAMPPLRIPDFHMSSVSQAT